MHSKNEEFLALMRQSGWSQAETARRLHISPAAVSQFVNGHSTPGRATLSLMKIVVGQLQLGTANDAPPAGLPGWASELIADLEVLCERERTRLVSAFRLITRREPRKKAKTTESASKKRSASWS
jgi:transcriptional regulator with XRE-family HTH domain